MSGLLTPQFFDALVIGVVIAGLILAGVRLMNDFKRGPRWPEQPAADPMTASVNPSEPQENKQ